MFIIRNNFDVELVQFAGSDEMICHAARVSTLGAEAVHTEESKGLITFLMRNRHGTPFEHGMMTFRISAPIFVWREFMRHRIGFSYNEESGRYRELDGVFYVPAPERPLIQSGKPGEYIFVDGDSIQYRTTVDNLVRSYQEAWMSYKAMLDAHIAKEVARMCLPVAIYSTAYVTCNPRSMMAFLSLRTRDPNSLFPSYPMYEINEVAIQMERIFSEKFTHTYGAFVQNGRVGP